MFRSLGKVSSQSLIASSFLLMAHLSGANFSVSTQESSGAGSFGDVIRSSNAIYPGDNLYNTLIFGQNLILENSYPTSRNNVNFQVLDQSILEFKSVISSSAAFKKSGLGVLSISSPPEFIGPWIISQGELFLKTNISPNTQIEVFGVLKTQNNQFLNDAIINLQDGSTLYLMQGDELANSINIKGSSQLKFDQDSLKIREIKGVGTLSKDAQGTLVIDQNNDLRASYIQKRGDTQILRGDLKGSVSIEGGTLKVYNQNSLKDSSVYLRNGIIDLNSNQFILSKPLSLEGGNAKLELNNKSAHLAKGFKGWGNILVNGPGIIRVDQSSNLRGNVYFKDLTLETNKIAPSSSYTYDNVKVQVLHPLIIKNTNTINLVNQVEIHQNGHNLTILGNLKGKGDLHLIGPGEFEYLTESKFLGNIVKDEGHIILNGNLKNLKMGNNGIFEGSGAVDSLYLSGTWQTMIEPTKSNIIESNEAEISGKVILKPKKGKYSPQIFSLLKAPTISLKNPQFLKPAQFEGDFVSTSSGLDFNLTNFYSIEDIARSKNLDDKMIARSLDEFFAPPGSEIDTVMAKLIGLKNDRTSFLKALQGLQPAYFSALGLVQESNFILARSSLSNRMQELLSFPCAEKYVKDQRFNLWLDPVGDFTEQKSIDSDMGYHASSIGGFLGFDGIINDDLRLGVSTGYTNSKVDWMEGVGKGIINSAYLALYFLYNPTQFYLDGSVNGGYSHYNANRYINISDIKAVAKHKNHGWGFSADVELGYVIEGKTKLQPYLRQSYIGLTQDKFNESGASDLDLKVNQKEFSMYRVEGGFIFNRCLNYENWVLVPEINISGIYEIELKTGTFHARYINSNQEYDVHGMKPSRLLFSPGISLDACIKSVPFMIGARYHAELCPKFYDQRISGHLGYSF